LELYSDDYAKYTTNPNRRAGSLQSYQREMIQLKKIQTPAALISGMGFGLSKLPDAPTPTVSL
jgi:hypothetical protein